MKRVVAMNKYVIINDVNTSFEQYFELDNVSLETQKKLMSVDILAVPTKYQDNEFYFAQETIDFLKFCRQNNPQYNIDVLADTDIRIRSLHSFDLWLPVIFIATNVILPIAVNLVSDYIKEKMKGREKEDVKVDVTFIVKRESEEKSLHFSGDAKTFKETFEKIDLNKM
jgi:hypothetical protein